MPHYLIIAISASIIIAIVTFFIFYVKRNSTKKVNPASVSTGLVPKKTNIINNEGNEVALMIKLEQMVSTVDIQNNMVKITDKTVLSRISNTLPAISQGTVQEVAKNAVSKAVQNTDIYKVIIPSGAALAKSADMDAAVRGFVRGAKGIKEHANLVKVSVDDITKATTVANAAANVMNIASMVVGQYYMSEINTKLEGLSKSIDKVSDFQQRQFKSEILTLIDRVSKITQFSAEILENDEQRIIKLKTLDELEGDCTQLHRQVDITIEDITTKNLNLDHQEYQKRVEEVSDLLKYQQILLTVAEEIAKLTYLLGKGNISAAQCFSLSDKLYMKSTQVRETVPGWHDSHVDNLKIDLGKNRMSKTGVSRVVSAPLGLIDESWNYKELNEGVVSQIFMQSQNDTLLLVAPTPVDLYDRDVEIVVQNGEYYYLNN